MLRAIFLAMMTGLLVSAAPPPAGTVQANLSPAARLRDEAERAAANGLCAKAKVAAAAAERSAAEAQNAADRADAKAATAAAAGCVDTEQSAAPANGNPQDYPSFAHRQTDCYSCQGLAAQLNREIDRYNGMSASASDKEGAWARVRDLADRLNECERLCPPDDRRGLNAPSPGMPGSPGAPYGNGAPGAGLPGGGSVVPTIPGGI